MLKPPGPPSNPSEQILAQAREAMAQAGVAALALPEAEREAFLHKMADESADRVAQRLEPEHEPMVKLYRFYLGVLITREMEP